jgi:prepilin-type N-terminal cleavage/methylation domain-containing protein
MQTSKSKNAEGFTLIELLIVVAVLGILAALATGHLLRAKAAANEASAISSLRAVVSGQSAYASTCGQGQYATLLSALVAAHFVSPDADLSPKSGYAFALGPGTGQDGPADCSGGATRTTYYMAGTPLSVSTGGRAFATNSAGTIWQSRSGIAPVEPFGSGDSEPLAQR